MLTVLLGTLLAAQEPVQLASVGFSAVNVRRPLVASFEETFALRLSQAGSVRVTTQKDVATVLGVERQKQLLGCADESTSCLAELAGALGSEGFIRGEVTQVGRVLQVAVRILSPTGQVLFSGLRRVKGDEAALIAIDELADEALRALLPKLRPPVPPVAAPVVTTPVVTAPVVTTPAAVQPRTAPWVVVGVGAGVVVLGAIAQGLAIADYNQLADLSRPVPDPRALRERGKLEQAIGLSLLAVGSVTTLGGVLWTALGAPVGAAAWLSPTGGGFTLSGAWP